ncbi:MAG: Hpt domain-containing protein [Rhodobacteraceae bacterium]|nr:Hpt domain-containing protein [Paracoccaceae bacterium]
MIDWTRVEELRAEIGCEDFAEVVELFLDEVDGVVARLQCAPDPTRFEDDLHFLKGSAWNLGFEAFGALCQNGERLASAGNPDSVNIEPIIACYLASRATFLEHGAAAPKPGASAA